MVAVAAAARGCEGFLDAPPKGRLAMEGHRLFDLQRWGEAQEILNDYVAVERTRGFYLNAGVPLAQRHDYYPIPSVQIELSRVDGEDRLVQNEGR